MDELFRTLKEGIVKLIDTFLTKPYVFYTESDLHCYLHHVLWTFGLNRGCMVKAGGRSAESMLLHRESAPRRAGTGGA